MTHPPHPDAVRELLQAMIRNECVNDGTVASGHEHRNADLVAAVLDDVGLEYERVEPQPGRTSILCRLPGRDPTAPSMALVGHLDVVPVTPQGWSRDPFAADLVNGEVWGRGAVDMLDVTSAMTLVVAGMAARGQWPRGDLWLAAVADEEAGGRWGAGWLAERDHPVTDVDHVLTESGGARAGTSTAPRAVVTVAEKGLAWRRLRITGEPGHGSTTWGSDNLLVVAGEVIRRLAAAQQGPVLHDLWQSWLEAADLTDEVASALADPDRFDDGLAAWAEHARYAHACTHMTVSPNVVRGGDKVNTRAASVEIDVDIRMLPGQTLRDVREILSDALGELAGQVDVEDLASSEPTRSPVDTRLYEVIGTVMDRVAPGVTPLPVLATGGTDARFFRQRGAVAYGLGLRSPALPIAEFRRRFHGNDERVDVESIRMTTELLHGVCTDFMRAG